jgi:hypothetical protein
MSISELGSLGEFISSIAVLITLVYLVFQIRQNTLSIRSQSRYYVLEALNADMRQAQNPDWHAMRKNLESGEASADEQSAWVMTVTAWLSHLEMLYLELVDGTLPKTFEATLRWRLATTFLNITLGRDAWALLRGYYTGGFQKYVDELLQEDLAAITQVGKHY